MTESVFDVSKRPARLFAGRRGQVVRFDLYDNPDANYSAAIVGTPGSGMTVCMHELACPYLGADAKPAGQETHIQESEQKSKGDAR